MNARPARHLVRCRANLFCGQTKVDTNIRAAIMDLGVHSALFQKSSFFGALEFSGARGDQTGQVSSSP